MSHIRKENRRLRPWFVLVLAVYVLAAGIVSWHRVHRTRHAEEVLDRFEALHLEQLERGRRLDLDAWCAGPQQTSEDRALLAELHLSLEDSPCQGALPWFQLPDREKQEELAHEGLAWLKYEPLLTTFARLRGMRRPTAEEFLGYAIIGLLGASDPETYLIADLVWGVVIGLVEVHAEPERILRALRVGNHLLALAHRDPPTSCRTADGMLDHGLFAWLQVVRESRRFSELERRELDDLSREAIELITDRSMDEFHLALNVAAARRSFIPQMKIDSIEWVLDRLATHESWLRMDRLTYARTLGAYEQQFLHALRIAVAIQSHRHRHGVPPRHLSEVEHPDLAPFVDPWTTETPLYTGHERGFTLDFRVANYPCPSGWRAPRERIVLEFED